MEAGGRVRRALIPAAGRGTRMRPFSDVVPKELVPLGSRPALDFVLAEAASAGLGEIVLVVREGKELLRRYADGVAAAGVHGELRPTFVEQPEPRGLGDAMLAAREALAGEPFALLLPDNLPLSPEYRLGRLVEIFQETGRDVVGVLELTEEDSGHYGRSGLFDGEELGGGVVRITRLRDKRPGRLEIAPGERLRRTCGRYVCHPRVLEHLEALRGRVEGELDEVPAYQRLAAAGELLGMVLPPPLFDVGHPAGVLAASRYLDEQGGD